MVDSTRFSLSDPGSARPRLRSELLITRHDSADAPYYVLEDPANGRFFRVGNDEYQLIRRLDGQQDLAGIEAACAATMGAWAYTADEILQVCHWLWREGLLEGMTETSTGGKGVGAPFNPLYWRMRLGNPGPLIARLHPRVRGLLSPAGVAAWALLVGAGLYAIAADASRFGQAAHGILSRDNALWLALIWCALKLAHETAHGVVCRHFGGETREAGVYFVLFMPLAYVDVSSLWRFRSKWARIATGGAGMYCELAIAAAAALVWANSPPGLASHLAYNTVLLGGVASPFFNANPLMRFDGYHMLADFLEIPNLYSRGSQYMRWLWRRLVTGPRAGPAPSWPGTQSRLIAVYGVASTAWRVTVSLVMMIAASALFAGAGLLLVLLAMGVALRPGLKTLFRRWQQGLLWSEIPALAPRLVGLAAALGVLLCLPWPGRFSAPAIVDFSTLTPVRATAPGFVRSVLVTTGSAVHEGQVLARLENDELVASRRDLELNVAAGSMRLSMSQARGELAAAAVIDGDLKALQGRLDELRRREASLAVTAPHAGVVITPRVETLSGKFVKTGAEIMTLADLAGREVRVSVAEVDARRFEGAVNQLVDLALDGGGGARARLTSFDPQAQLTVSDQAVTALAGGVIPVQARETTQAGAAYEYLAPRFVAKAKLTGEDLPAAGQRAEVFLSRRYVPAAEVLYQRIAAWLGNSLRNATRAPRSSG